MMRLSSKSRKYLHIIIKSTIVLNPKPKLQSKNLIWKNRFSNLSPKYLGLLIPRKKLTSQAKRMKINLQSKVILMVMK